MQEPGLFLSIDMPPLRGGESRPGGDLCGNAIALIIHSLDPRSYEDGGRCPPYRSRSGLRGLLLCPSLGGETLDELVDRDADQNHATNHRELGLGGNV